MKIAIDISQIAYPGTGIATYTEQLVRNLIRQDSENEYILFGYSLRKKPILDNFFEEVKTGKVTKRFYYIPQSLINIVWNKHHIFNVDRLISKVDIFHSSDWIQPPTTVKKVTTVHDMIIYKHPEVSHPYIISTQKKRMEWVKKECDKIICDSFSTQNDLISLMKINQNKLSVVYPGIDEIYSKQDDEEIKRIKQKYNLPHEFILFVGTSEPRKNLKLVLNAFSRFLTHQLIIAKEKKINLVLAGNYGWGGRPEEKSNVQVLGFIDKKDLPGLYSAATVFVYPSTYEGFGLPVLEAMACGCPVITTDKGSLKEIAGDAAITIGINEEELTVNLTKIFIDHNLRWDMIKKGISNSAKFSWKHTVTKVLEIYKKLIEENT